MDSHIVTLARKQIQVISIKALGLRLSGALDMCIKKEAIFGENLSSAVHSIINNFQFIDRLGGKSSRRTAQHRRYWIANKFRPAIIHPNNFNQGAGIKNRKINKTIERNTKQFAMGFVQPRPGPELCRELAELWDAQRPVCASRIINTPRAELRLTGDNTLLQTLLNWTLRQFQRLWY